MSTAIDRAEVVFYSADPREAEAVHDSLECARLHPHVSTGGEPVTGVGGATFGGGGGEFYRVTVPPDEAVRARTILDVTPPPDEESEVPAPPMPVPRRVTVILLVLLALCPVYAVVTMGNAPFPITAVVVGTCLGVVFASFALAFRR